MARTKMPIYLDDQGGSVMQVVRNDVAPTLLLNGMKGHSLVVCRPKTVLAFAQNTREEVRVLGDDGNVAGCVSAENGTHQTTYLVVKGRRSVPCRTNYGTRKNIISCLSVDTKQIAMNHSEEVAPAIIMTSYKEPPVVVVRGRK